MEKKGSGQKYAKKLKFRCRIKLVFLSIKNNSLLAIKIHKWIFYDGYFDL